MGCDQRRGGDWNVWRDPIVNNFNSYNFKEKDGGKFTLYSFGEFAVKALFYPGMNKHNKQVSWTTQ